MRSSDTEAAARVAQVDGVLARIAAASHARGFAWTVLNGLPQARQLHPHPAQRELGSIDVLVPAGQTRDIAAVLVLAGFRRAPAAPRVPGLAAAGLRSDARTTLHDAETGEAVHLHERRYFTGATIPLSGDAGAPRRSIRPDDVPAPTLGAGMALDILLRGNHRRWAEPKWIADLTAVLGRLDAAELSRLIDAIDAAGFAPGAAASLLTCRDAAGVALPGPLAAWLEPWQRRAEVAVRRAMFAGGDAPVIAVSSAAPVQRGAFQRLGIKIARQLGLSRRFTPEPATRIDRYPLAFAFARAGLRDRTAVRLLSFGCSNGAEVCTLRGYFPDAAIKGIDIDRHLIAAARARAAGDMGITFEVAGSAAGEPPSSHDAAFCMAVLRDPAFDHPDCRHATGSTSFAAFECEIGALVDCLKPGGLLFVAHANFRVADTRFAARLAPVLHSDPPRSGLVPGLYGVDGQRIEGAATPPLGWVKVG